MNKESDHKKVRAVEGTNVNICLRKCASLIGSIRIFHSKDWIERERLTLK